MARYRILSWRDIPAQVKVFEEGRRPLSVTLSERWQQEIDRVAMRDGLVGTDDYLSQWEWSQDAERDGSAEDVLDALVSELEASWETRRGEPS
jgi:cvfA/B/C family virulence factor